MATDPNRLEVDRIRNLVSGFGWEIVKEEYPGDTIIIVMQKKKVAPAVVSPGAA